MYLAILSENQLFRPPDRPAGNNFDRPDRALVTGNKGAVFSVVDDSPESKI